MNIHCPDDPLWNPTKEDFEHLIAHFTCDKFLAVGVLDLYEDEPLDFEYIDFQTNVPSKDYIKYFKKAKTYVVHYMLDVPQWSQHFDECAKGIDQSIMCDWVPWTLSFTIGKQSLPDSYTENPLFKCNFSIGIGGDGYPLDLIKCNDEICGIEPIKDICSTMKSLNNKQWVSYISCSF